MPAIYDNIQKPLLPALRGVLGKSCRADFCVGNFNLRGWQALDEQVMAWAGGERAQVRLSVDEMFIPYARPWSKTEGLAKEALSWGKKVWTLEHTRNKRTQPELTETVTVTQPCM